MGVTKEQLLARLKELGIKFEQYEHPAVLTVEAQEKYVGGGLREILLLKDKKSRFYIFSALAGAKVDMKEAWFGERGHKNGSGRRIRTATSAIQASDLDKFLKSIGREPSYSYLEANPPVGKDQPLDLAIFVPSCTIDVPDALESSTPSQFVSESSLPIQKKSTPASVKSAKPSSGDQNAKDKPNNTASQPNAFAESRLFVDEILKKTLLLLCKISTLTGDVAKQEALTNCVRKHLAPDLQNLTVMFKNTTYTQGFYAGSNCQPRRL